MGVPHCKDYCVLGSPRFRKLRYWPPLYSQDLQVWILEKSSEPKEHTSTLDKDVTSSKISASYIFKTMVGGNGESKGRGNAQFSIGILGVPSAPNSASLVPCTWNLKRLRG